METLKNIYLSNLVDVTIVDTSNVKYSESAALRIVTHDWLDGDIDTIQPLSKQTIDALLTLDDWQDEPDFYKALRQLREHLPQTSNEPAQPTYTSEIIKAC